MLKDMSSKLFILSSYYLMVTSIYTVYYILHLFYYINIYIDVLMVSVISIKATMRDDCSTFLKYTQLPTLLLTTNMRSTSLIYTTAIAC